MMEDLENGWSSNTPDAPWNQDDAAPGWLEEYQLAMDAMYVPKPGDIPGTQDEAEEILEDIAHAAMSGLSEMERGLQVYLLVRHDEAGPRVVCVFQCKQDAVSHARKLNGLARAEVFYSSIGMEVM